MNDFGEDKTDYFVASFLYLITLGFLFVIQKFKHEEIQYENIEEIGNTMIKKNNY